ncbi:hypothetical protein I7I48_02723 [Histoplasma ohiense]|nr:hypothetical protein I7I48_02723 [Histoplasma ohiense (nom. inval.)]
MEQCSVIYSSRAATLLRASNGRFRQTRGYAILILLIYYFEDARTQAGRVSHSLSHGDRRKFPHASDSAPDCTLHTGLFRGIPHIVYVMVHRVIDHCPHWAMEIQKDSFFISLLPGSRPSRRSFGEEKSSRVGDAVEVKATITRCQ